MIERPQLVAWDLGGTVFPENFWKQEANSRIFKGNALELMAAPSCLPINPDVERRMREYSNIPQAVISDCAYQIGVNFIAASALREIIDPKLIFLSHKLAWEGMMNGQSYDKVLEQYMKPSAAMFDLARQTLSEREEIIRPDNCLYIGDTKTDEQASKNAGWQFLHVDKLKS